MLTIRTGPRVERSRFDALHAALAALEARAGELTGAAAKAPAETKLRRYGAEEQVVARLELAGPQRRLPRVHAGIDVRGDGSSEAYIGRVRRQPIHQDSSEDAVAALHRVLRDR